MRTTEAINVAGVFGEPFDPFTMRKCHEALVAELKRPDIRFNHEATLDEYRRYGIGGLSKASRLSLDENARLAISDDVHDILELLVKGLPGLARGQA